MNEVYYPLFIRLLSKKEKNAAFDDEAFHSCTFDNIIAPLLKACLRAYAYQGCKEPFYLFGKMNDPIDLAALPFLKKERGKYAFDLSQDCISQYEFFWNAVAHRRGSIVIVLPPYTDLSYLFEDNKIDLLANPYSGNNKAAIDLCKKEMTNGNLAFCLSASNGMEDAVLYGDTPMRQYVLMQQK